MNWHRIPFWQLTIALTRKGLEWWWDPQFSRSVLKARDGSLYDFKAHRLGVFIRKRYQMP